MLPAYYRRYKWWPHYSSTPDNPAITVHSSMLSSKPPKKNPTAQGSYHPRPLLPCDTWASTDGGSPIQRSIEGSQGTDTHTRMNWCKTGNIKAPGITPRGFMCLNNGGQYRARTSDLLRVKRIVPYLTQPAIRLSSPSR